jgi:hypothetical protein
MSILPWNVILGFLIAVSSVSYGFLTNVIDDVVREDTGDAHLFEEKDRDREVKEKALEKLQEVGENIITTECFQDYIRRRRHR